MRVSPDEIRKTAKTIDHGAQRWNEAVTAMSDADAAAFGGDSVGRMIGAFHAKTYQRSVQYYTEVGTCAADTATALAAAADLYENTELDNQARADEVGALVDQVGTIF